MSKQNINKIHKPEDLHINFEINSDNQNLVDTNTEVIYTPKIEDTDKKIQILKPENLVTTKDSYFLYKTNFIACLTAFVAGIGFAWTSPVFPKLQGSENPLSIFINASQESIIASILCVGAALGPLPFGYLADKIGRKNTLVIIAMPMMIAMGIAAFTSKVKMYYLARLFHGCGIGGVFTVLTMYISEITEDHNRGKFCCIMIIFVALGLLYPFSIGPMLSIRNLCLFSLVPLILFLIFFTMCCPETPPYLIKKKKYDVALKTLMNLRDKSEDGVRKELEDLKVIAENQQREKSGIAEIFRSKSTRKGFVVAVGLLIVQQMSGINAVMGFMQNIFLASGSAIPSQVSTTVIGVVQVLTVLVTASVVEKLGRKFLLFSSIIGVAVSLICLGLYFFLQSRQVSILSHFWWLPILSLFVYTVSYNLGLGPIPWTILSEVFPNNVKASASALASCINFMVSFVVTMAFPLVSEILGMAGSFLIFGISCGLNLIFVYYVVPETKGKTLTEIQQILSQ